ncbi:hypothetical protein EON83_02060 [bacterium]|nr:MAG: hypothetical protein EON83_02060 [bacterium]
MLFRHGDVLIQMVGEVPTNVQKLNTNVLAHGEVTGHSHRLESMEGVSLWNAGEVLFMQVAEKATRVIHEEHAPIDLPVGTYRVWRQREYTPTRIVRVSD